MGESIIRFLEWIKDLWRDYISPWIIVRCYEGGVLLRLGHYHHNLKEGFNWKFPFFDEVHTVITTIDTYHLLPVDVTTLDGKQISVEPILKFEISDPKKYLIDTNIASDNLHDVSRGTIADYLSDCEWEDIKKKTTLTQIKNSLKKECDDMGITILKVYFGRIVTTKIYTVFKE